MKFLKDPESQVVTRRLSADTANKMQEMIASYEELSGELMRSGDPFAREQREIAGRTVSAQVDAMRHAIRFGVKVNGVDKTVAENVRNLDTLMQNMTTMMDKIESGEFDESELAEYGE